MPIKYFYKDRRGDGNGEKCLADFEDWKRLRNVDFTPDFAFCFYMIEEWGIVPTPLSVFYDNNLEEKK